VCATQASVFKETEVCDGAASDVSNYEVVVILTKLHSTSQTVLKRGDVAAVLGTVLRELELSQKDHKTR